MIRFTIGAIVVFVSLTLLLPAQIHQVHAGEKISGDLGPIKFPAENWSPGLLAIIDRGAVLLDSDMPLVLDPPPLNGSVIVHEELDYLRRLKSKRTPDQRSKIHHENRQDIVIADRFLKAGGYEPLSRIQTRLLLMTVINEVSYFLFREKHKFQRARPSQLADDLELVIDNPPHASYPSGHAGQSWAMALIMARLDPDQEDTYKSFSRDVAWRRELAGVHYPSDSKAGRQVAEQVVEALRDTPYYKRQFAAAQTEF